MTHLIPNARREWTCRLLAGVVVAVGLARGEALAQDRRVTTTVDTLSLAEEPLTPTLSPQAGRGSRKVSMPIHDAVAKLTASPIAAAQSSRRLVRNPVILGTLIGAAGGAVWQASACGGLACNVGTAGLVGAGAGAYGGLVASAIQKARAKQPVSRSMKIGIAAGAIGAIGGAWLACYAAGGCGGVS